MQFGNKTNKHWYPYKDLGSYYKLVEGRLIFSPMLVNGKRDDWGVGEVDWEFLSGEWITPEQLFTDRLKEIGYELSVKL